MMFRRVCCFIAIAFVLISIPAVITDSSDAMSIVDNDDGLPIAYEMFKDPSSTTIEVKTVVSTNPYKGDYRPLVIPRTVNIDGIDYNVTLIGASSFSGWNISSITIPDTVRKIEKDAFLGCNRVTSIHLNGELTADNIGDNAFCLGNDKISAECDLYGFTPTRNVWDVDNPYEDIFGKNTTVHYKDISPNSRDSIIHIALICIGVAALLYMGRSVRVRKIKRRKVRRK